VGLVDARLGQARDRRQVDAVVDAERQRRVVDEVRADGMEVQQRVGEVLLALDVVGRQALERATPPR